jgi:hypothetical protein
LQVNVAAQSPGSTHASLQALLPSHANGVQSVTCGVHWPPPQAYAVSIDAEQVDGMQVVPAG